MGTLILATLLMLIEKSRLRAGTGFHLLPSFHHHHPTQHNYSTQTVTHTVTITSTFYSTLYKYSSHTQCGLPKRCVNRHLSEAGNSAVGWHWNNTHLILCNDTTLVVIKTRVFFENYFQFTHRLGRPHYVRDEYLYSVL